MYHRVIAPWTFPATPPTHPLRPSPCSLLHSPVPDATPAATRAAARSQPCSHSLCCAGRKKAEGSPSAFLQIVCAPPIYPFILSTLPVRG